MQEIVKQMRVETQDLLKGEVKGIRKTVECSLKEIK